MTKYSASDEFIVWLQSLSGMLTKIKTEYGSVSELLEHPSWDENHTPHAARLVRALREHLQEIDAEIEEHVAEKFG